MIMIMNMWRTAYRFSSASTVVKMSRYSGNGELVISQSSAHYHSTTSLLWPRDTGSKVHERLKRSPVSSSGDLSRSAGPPPPSNRSRREAARASPDRRLSSELQKLSLEGLTDREIRKLHKGKKNQAQANVEGEKRDEMVFGVAPCLLALTQEKRKPRRLFVKTGEGPPREAVQKVCEEALKRDLPIQRVTKRELEKMTGGGVHQGVCLQASPVRFLTETKSEKSTRTPRGRGGSPHPLWLVLDGVQDPMNLGSILRSAYFLGVDQVASSIRNSCPLTPVVSKASSGVMELMDVYGYNNLSDMIKVKLGQGWQAIGTVGSEEANSGLSVVPCSDFKMSKPTLLLMGGEGSGLSLELSQLCDVFLTIPPRKDLHPAVDSLNVSVATGILLHTILSSSTAA